MALPEGWVELGGPPGEPGVVGSPCPRMGGYSRGLGRVGMPSRRTRIGWKALPKGREWSEVPASWPGGVRIPSRRVMNGRDTLPGDWQWSKGAASWSGWFKRPFQRAGRGHAARPEGQEGL